MDQETNLFIPVFSVLAVLTFFFVITAGNSSRGIFAAGFDLNKCTKPEYSQVYNCYNYPSPTCVSGNRTFGYGFGLKNNSLAASNLKRDGFGYGYCMNYSYNYVKPECLIPEFKKVYECERNLPINSVGSCGDQRLSAINGKGYGYGFAKDSNFTYKRTGMGYGKCESYIDADYYTSNQSTFYYFKYLKCLAGINNC